MPACAVLRRVRRLCEKTENRQKSSKNRSDGPARPRRAQTTRIFRSRRRIGVEINCLGALPDAPEHPQKSVLFSQGHFLGLSGRSRDRPCRFQGAPESLPARSRRPQGVPRGSWNRFRLDFGCPRESRDRFYTDFCVEPFGETLGKFSEDA